jgi:TonB-linked SusC/RagA family outer membrane protein
MRKFLLTMIVFAFSAVQLLAQGRTVTGRVTSVEEGDPLPGVSVVLKGTGTGTVTDANGNYSISVPADGILTFSFIGLKSIEIPVNSKTTIDATMEGDVRQLSEVIVVAYGVQEKKSITGAVSSVNAERIRSQPVRGLDQALQGVAAGVQVTQNSGTPGSGIAVRVRGSSSILAGNDPLYVVDGIPINTGNYSMIGVGNQQVSALNDISPNDIESIEVLKDAAAASLYGSRAANGVVLITTKKGKSDKTRINVNHYTGFQEAWKRFDPLTGPETIELLADALVGRYGVGTGTTGNPQGVQNADGTVTTPTLRGSGNQTWADKYHLAGWYWGNSAVSGNAQMVPGAIASVTRNGAALEVNDVGFYLDPSTAPSTDWQDEIFRTAPITNTDVSFSGGSDKTRFFSSVGYFKQDGIILGSGFQRANGRLNLDFDATEKLSFTLQNAFSRSLNNRINNDNNIFGVLSTAVLNSSDFPVRTSNGNYARDPRNSIDNPLAQAKEPTNIAASNRLLSGLKGTYEFTPNISFTTGGSVDYLYFREDRFIPTTTAQGLSANGQGDVNTAQELNWINENILNFQKSFDDHNVSALLGASFQESKQQTTAATATGFPGNDLRVLSAGSVKTVANSGATSWALTSYFMRVNYDFKGKYIFNASFRADESSRFSEKNRVGYFPSVSGAWRIGDEPFAEGLDFINDLKLRASYGSTGNQDLSTFTANFVNFNYLSLFSPGSNYLQLAGYSPGALGNEDLKWETTNQLDIGLDIGLFQKVTLTVDYYIKKTKDLLLSRPIPSTSGFNTFVQNIGDLENKGLEVTVSATPVSTKSGLTWKTDFNIAFNKNEVVRLATDVPPFASGFANWVKEGEPLGAFRGFKVESIFQSQEEINALNAAAPDGIYSASLTRPGDIKFSDLNGDGDLTGDDQEIIGSAQPDFIGGWTNTLNYKSIDFSVFAQFVYGNEIYNNTRSFSEGMNGIFGQTREVLNRWTPANTDTDMPRAVFGDPNNNRRVSDRWLEDGSFLRIKSVVLGYTLPKSILDRIKLSNIRIYASAQNLFTFTDYSGLDPEVNTFSGSNTSLGTDFLTFPQARTITFGVNVGF